jgi:hypothetical protein
VKPSPYQLANLFVSLCLHLLVVVSISLHWNVKRMLWNDITLDIALFYHSCFGIASFNIVDKGLQKWKSRILN